MMDKKHNEPQDDSYYDALIKQRIGEALRNQSRKERLDLAQLEEWVEADRQRRRAKVKRILAVASCFIILCIGTFSLKFVFDPDDSIATAGKNDNKVTEEGNNVVVKPNEDGVDENIGSQSIVIDKIANVKEIQKQYPALKFPHYVPESYYFESLSIKDNDIVNKFIYSFTDGVNQIEIKQLYGDVDMAVFYQNDRVIEGDKIKIYVNDEKDGKVAYYSVKEDEIIYIYTDCADTEIEKIAEALK